MSSALEGADLSAGEDPQVVGLIGIDTQTEALALVDREDKRVVGLPNRPLVEGESPLDVVAELIDESFGGAETFECPDVPTFLFDFPRVGERHAYYRVQLDGETEASGSACPTPLAQALQLAIRPHIVGETVLRAAVTGIWPTEPIVVEDPWSKPPERVRAGMIVVCGDRLLVIARERPNGQVTYELPGGGVDEQNEAPAAAARRELQEETGLVVQVGQQLALVHEMGWFHHYFLPSPDSAAALTLTAELAPEDPALSHGNFGRPVWLNTTELRRLDLWPRRLAWRIAAWIDNGLWPSDVVELTDGVRPGTACSW